MSSQIADPTLRDMLCAYASQQWEPSMRFVIADRLEELGLVEVAGVLRVLTVNEYNDGGQSFWWVGFCAAKVNENPLRWLGNKSQVTPHLTPRRAEMELRKFALAHVRLMVRNWQEASSVGVEIGIIDNGSDMCKCGHLRCEHNEGEDASGSEEPYCHIYGCNCVEFKLDF
jgi:hypothetical protein